MGIRESALSTLSALTNNDFIRMVSSAGASRKATLQAIAQHIIETYAGSSLAGSNQSVKAAIDGLNSTTTWKSVTLAAGNNVTILDQKAYECGGILFVFCRWKATAQLADYQAVLTTGKAAKMAWNAPLMGNNNVPIPGYGLYADIGNGSARATGTIPAGTYRTYFVIPIA